MIKFEYIDFETLETISNKSQPMFFDTETDGLYGEVLLAQFYQEEWECVYFIRFPPMLELIAYLSKQHIVAHNSSYDISTIQRQSHYRFIPDRIDDTLLMSRLHYYNSLDFSLDHVSELAFGYDVYSANGLDKSKMQKCNWKVKELDSLQEMYAALDVFVMCKVYKETIEVKEDFNYKLDILSIKYSFDFQCNGFPTDSVRLKENWDKAEKEINELNVPINCKSPKQCKEYLYTYDSCELTLLNEIERGSVKAKNVLLTRKALTLKSFITKFTSPDKKIYGLFSPSARSGRFTCKQQNLQQIPRKLKHCFSAEDGQVFLYSDFSQLELRAICSIIDEPKMTQLFKEFDDLHMFTAKMIFGDNPTDDQRYSAKTANFGLLYGAGVKTFTNILIKNANLFLTNKEVVELVRSWKRLWPTIAHWQQRGVRKWKAGKPTETPLGRKAKSKMLTDFLNIEVQGFGAEIAKLAMHYMLRDMKEQGLDKDVKLVNFIHDSYIFTVPEDDRELIDKASAIIAKSMQTAWFECTKHVRVSDIPMPVDVLIGKNWGDIEDKVYLYKHSLKGLEYYDCSN